MYIKKIVAWFLTLGIILGYLIVGFKAYFINVYTDHGMTDGLGRHLVEAPTIYTAVTQELYWAGFYWASIDAVLFWCGMGLLYGIVHFFKDVLFDNEQ